MSLVLPSWSNFFNFHTVFFEKKLSPLRVAAPSLGNSRSATEGLRNLGSTFSVFGFRTEAVNFYAFNPGLV